MEEVAEVSFLTKQEWTERGRVLPRTRAVRSAFFRLAETSRASGGQEVYRSESGAHDGCGGSGSRPGHRDRVGRGALSSGAAGIRCPASASGVAGIGAALMMGLPSLQALDQAPGVRMVGDGEDRHAVRV
jgi:hypothetical protein